MKNEREKIHIGVIGLWHLGCVYAASLAHLGYRVTGFDPDSKVIKSLNRGLPPIYEPQLENMLKKHLHKNLFFTNNPLEAIGNKNYVFLALDIAVDDKDRINLALFNKLVTLVAKFSSSGTKIIISSQIPAGTCRLLINKFKKAKKKIEVIYFPENLKLGRGFETFLQPDRIILGTDNKKNIEQFKTDFPHFKCPILAMSPESAEMVKHALNTFLAINISFAGEIGDLCELTGADIKDVVAALKTDNRINSNAPINPGLGFAGGTLGRDIQTVIKISQKYNYNPKLINAAYQVNRDRLIRLVSKIEKILTTLVGKNIGLLGLTYKPDTDTLRRSQSLDLAEILHEKGSIVKALDPKIDKLNNYDYIKVMPDITEFFKGLDMAILMTQWPQFKEIDPQKIAAFMKNNIIFDTKSFLTRDRYISAGFKFFVTGQPL